MNEQQLKFDSLYNDIQNLEMELSQLTIKQNQLQEKRRQLQTIQNAWELEENHFINTILTAISSTNCLFLTDLAIIIKNYCLILSIRIAHYTPHLNVTVLQTVISINFDKNLCSISIGFNDDYDDLYFLKNEEFNVSLFMSLQVDYSNYTHSTVYQKQLFTFDTKINQFLSNDTKINQFLSKAKDAHLTQIFKNDSEHSTIYLDLFSQDIIKCLKFLFQ